ncbi:MAG TPA: winged helix-turn-helix domain-containing protein [Bryobacteraceae bacterium]|nr:winged helix-turn-helix domain-containing protein [Bryobacteraceae bacterium]
MIEVIQIDANRTERYSDPRLTVDFRTKTVTLDLKPVELTKMEFRLLALLAENAGEVVPRASLLRDVWGYGPGICTRTLDVHVRRLRAKLGDYSRQHIETIFSVGYRLQPYRGFARLPNVASA